MAYHVVNPSTKFQDPVKVGDTGIAVACAYLYHYCHREEGVFCGMQIAESCQGPEWVICGKFNANFCCRMKGKVWNESMRNVAEMNIY